MPKQGGNYTCIHPRAHVSEFLQDEQGNMQTPIEWDIQKIL